MEKDFRLAKKYLGTEPDGATRYRSAVGEPSLFNFRTNSLYDSRKGPLQGEVVGVEDEEEDRRNKSD